jgi:hypothetical protein
MNVTQRQWIALVAGTVCLMALLGLNILYLNSRVSSLEADVDALHELFDVCWRLTHSNMDNVQSLSDTIEDFEDVLEAQREKLSELEDKLERFINEESMIRNGFTIESRKDAYPIGYTVTFNIRSLVPMIGSLIVVTDSTGSETWVTAPLEGWIEVDGVWVVPFVRQLAEGAPMVLEETHPTGTWTWAWYDGEDLLYQGEFTVK